MAVWMGRTGLVTLVIAALLAGCGGRAPQRPAADPGVPAVEPAPPPSRDPAPPTQPNPAPPVQTEPGGSAKPPEKPPADAPSAPAPAPVPEPSPPAAGAKRQKAGSLQGTAYYLDVFADRVELLGVSAKGQAVVATVRVSIDHAQVWSHVWPGGIALMISPYTVGPDGLLYRVDPQSGTVTDLGAVASPPFRMDIAPGGGGRYLAMKLAGYLDPLLIVDLETGARVALQTAQYNPGLAWSPARAVLAARAADRSSGLPAQIGSQYWDGGNRIDLITSDGQFTSLLPPQPLQLVYGPFWSPDGQWLAVAAGTVLPIGKGPGGGSQFEQREIWLVNVAGSGSWVRFRETLIDERLDGWPPGASEFIKR